MRLYLLFPMVKTAVPCLVSIEHYIKNTILKTFVVGRWKDREQLKDDFK